jgi:hypothetical protein
MWLDIVGLHYGLFLPVALSQVVTGELDFGGSHMKLLVGRSYRVASRVKLDVAFEDLAIAEQQHSRTIRPRGRWLRGVGCRTDEKENAKQQ